MFVAYCVTRISTPPYFFGRLSYRVTDSYLLHRADLFRFQARADELHWTCCKRRAWHCMRALREERVAKVRHCC